MEAIAPLKWMDEFDILEEHLYGELANQIFVVKKSETKN